MPDPSSLHADIDAVLPLREHLVVLGPCYLKIIEDVGEIPNSGENVKGTPLKVFPGGKSGNQAVAAGLLGAPVSLVAAVGNDESGNLVLRHLRQAHVNTKHVQTVDEPTTTALVTIDADGDRTEVTSAGANDQIDVSMVENVTQLIGNASLLGLALEMPLNAVQYAMKVAHARSTMVVLNPSPLPDTLPSDFLGHADVLILNEDELAGLLDVDDIHSWERALEGLREHGVTRAIVTRGPKGAVVLEDGVTVVDAVPVQAVDTDGCGDAFIGAALAALASDASVLEAARFASIVAAYAALGHGEQSSYGTLKQIEQRFGIKR